MALEKEHQTYLRELPKLLLTAVGKFVLIHDNDVVGIYENYTDALKRGYDTFGLSPFLVNEIEKPEKMHSFTRELVYAALKSST